VTRVSAQQEEATASASAMLHAEGDLSRHGSALVSYGTLDESPTGEHDKMAKDVWRILDEDHLVFEAHDLPIGETNTKVVEFRYARAEG